MAAVTLLAAAAVAGGCGGAGDARPPGAAGQDGAGAESSTSARSEEQRIEAMLLELREDYNAGAARGWCSKLTAAGRGEIRRFGRAMGHGSRCVPIMVRHFDRDDRTGVPPFDIRSIDVQGSRAIATATGGIAGSVPAAMRLVRRGGEWRVANPFSVSAYD